MKYKYVGNLKNGKTFEIRFPKNGDAEQLRTYHNLLSKEKTFTVYQGEEISLQEENVYLKKILKNIKTSKDIALFLCTENKIVGSVNLSLKSKIYSHVSNISISLVKEYRQKGLGQLMLEQMLKKAKEIKTLKLVTLQVHSVNYPAINLYTKLGFKEYGRLPKGVKFHSHFVDEILMYKKLR
jgi:RimJ/RimL family protein N-acetyltransferase